MLFHNKTDVHKKSIANYKSLLHSKTSPLFIKMFIIRGGASNGVAEAQYKLNGYEE
jgi:hypothetical protein